MKIEEQVLSVEQMKRLQELGVDTSDASMVWVKQEPSQNSDDEFVPWKVFVFKDWMKYYIGAETFILTYTIGDLIEKLPKYYYAKENPLEMCAINGSGAFAVDYFNIANSCEKDDTIKNALYKSLCWVAENHKELLEVRNEKENFT